MQIAAYHAADLSSKFIRRQQRRRYFLAQPFRQRFLLTRNNALQSVKPLNRAVRAKQQRDGQIVGQIPDCGRCEHRKRPFRGPDRQRHLCDPTDNAPRGNPGKDHAAGGKAQPVNDLQKVIFLIHEAPLKAGWTAPFDPSCSFTVRLPAVSVPVLPLRLFPCTYVP